MAAGPERRIVRSALCTGEISAPRGFTPIEEIAAIAWWDGAEPLPGPTPAVDVHLAGLTRPNGRGGSRVMEP